jgi:hypothetical protein
MPIPRGARQVPGSPNRVELASGEVVTRATARTLGAREMGYRNERERSKFGKGDDAYFKSWVRTEQGQRAIARAKELARADGVPYRPGDLKSELIAARNARPHGSGRVPGTPGKPAGDAWLRFMERYDMDTDDYVDY